MADRSEGNTWWVGPMVVLALLVEGPALRHVEVHPDQAAEVQATLCHAASHGLTVTVPTVAGPTGTGNSRLQVDASKLEGHLTS